MMKGDKHLLLLIVVAVFFIGFRVYNIENPFSTNGIDEGIHLLQAKMVDHGYNLYTDLKSDQAPVAILTFSLMHNSVIESRMLSFTLFGMAAATSSFIAYLIKSKQAGVYTLLILSLDFTLLRESRLASLDLFSAALLTLGVLCLLLYIKREYWQLLVVGAILISLSCLAKMLAIPSAILISIWLAYTLLKNRKYTLLTAYILGGLIPIALLLLLFSPEMLIEGLIVRQTHRLYEWGTKASIFLFIGPSFVYLAALRRWDFRDKQIILLVLWLLPTFIFIIAQGLTFQHHFAYAAFPAAILASIAIASWPKKERRALLASFVAINAVLGPALIISAPTDMAYQVADTIEDITLEDTVIIVGNPLVTVLADRLAPPNMTNLAYYHYPPTTTGNISYWLKNKDVAVVGLYWKLAEMEKVEQYLNHSDSYVLYTQFQGKGQMVFAGITPTFSTDKYTLYVNSSLKPSP